MAPPIALLIRLAATMVFTAPRNFLFTFHALISASEPEISRPLRVSSSWVIHACFSSVAQLFRVDVKAMVVREVNYRLHATRLPRQAAGGRRQAALT